MKYFKYVAFVFFIICLMLCVCWEWQYDEAWSYLGSLGSTTYQIINYWPFSSSNNHLTNTLFIKLVRGFDAKHVFWYRLHSLGSFVLYSVYYFKYLKYKDESGSLNTISSSRRIVIYLFPFVFPFIVYFSMARGYALAISCSMAALYFFTRYNKEQKAHLLVLFVFFGLLSSLSMFTFLYLFGTMCIFLVVSNFRVLLRSLKSPKYLAIYLLTLSIAMMVVYYIYQKGKIINITAARDNMEHLFKNGFISSLLSYFLAQDFLAMPVLLSHVLRISILLCFVALTIVLYQKNKWTIPIEHKMAATIILLIIVFKIILKANYPFARTIPYVFLFSYLPLLTSDISKKAVRIVYYFNFSILIAIGFYNIENVLRVAFSTSTLDTLTYVSKKYENTPIIINLENPIFELYNSIYFDNKLPLLLFSYGRQLPLAGNTNYVLLSAEKISPVFAGDEVTSANYRFYCNGQTRYVYQLRTAAK